MTERLPSIPGLVCWIEVSSSNPVGSREFYAGLFGWTYLTDPHAVGGRYTTALFAGLPVAGLADVPVPPGRLGTWTLYLASSNVALLSAAVTRWGGRVLDGPTEISGQGRVLIVTDPTGAVVGFWQLARPLAFYTGNPAALVWAELNTWDGALADGFFAKLFSYDQQQIGDGRIVDYTTWSRMGHTMLGRLQMNDTWAAPGTPAHWMLHFAVDPQIGTDAVAAQVRKLGGQVDIDPYDTELGRTARVTDPFGASFALIDPTQRVELATDLAPGSALVDDPYDD